MIRFTDPRACVPIVLLALTLLAPARPAKAQFVVWDPGNYAGRLVEYAMQGLQYAENIQTVRNLVRQVQQLDDQIDHFRDAANGRIAALASTVTNFTSNPARLLGDIGVSWDGAFTPTSRGLLDALVNMDGSSLVEHLQDELNAADAIGETELLNLFPDPDRGMQLAERWNEQRDHAERLRVTDFAVAEAAGRITQQLDDAQDNIAALRTNGNASPTALQQASLASQLTESEINLAVAQLLALEAQKTALQRQEQELLARQRLERWVQREQLRQAAFRDILDAEEGRRAANRGLLRLPQRHGN